jgi:tripartite-type tricarboxylate transporter receptor subunit TctC
MNSRKLLRHRSAAVFLACVAVSFTTVSFASAQTTPKTKVVKPDFSFYVGKQLTLITGGAAGAANDEAALIVAPLMASYLHASINVVDMPAGATVPAQEAIAASTPNGLTFGQGGPVGDIESQDVGQNDINFPLRTQEWIGSFSPPQYVIATTPNSGIKTISQFEKADGGGLKYLSLSGGGSLNEQVFDVVFKQHAQFVTGYINASAQLTGFLRGDGNASVINAPMSAPFIADGQMVGIALTQPYVKGETDYSVMSKLPVMSTYLAKHPPTSKANRTAIKLLNIYNAASDQDFFAPPKTPEGEVLALAAAFRSAVNQPGAQKALIGQGVPNGYDSPAKVAAQVDEMIKVGPQIAPYLGGSP